MSKDLQTKNLSMNKIFKSGEGKKIEHRILFSKKTQFVNILRESIRKTWTFLSEVFKHGV